MPFSRQQIRQVIKAAHGLSLDAQSETVEDFFAKTLGLNAMQRATHFPSPDPAGLFAVALGHLTSEREITLREACRLPPYVVYKDVLGTYRISGAVTYLRVKRFNTRFLSRIRQHNRVRTALMRLHRGHDLEAVAAAVMNEAWEFGEATTGSGDQGIDGLGWNKLLPIDECFLNGDVAGCDVFPGEKLFILASSKATVRALPRGQPNLVDPAHIRELVGGWLIQRTSTGIWQKRGIRMLTPVQMVFVTTYKLSVGAKAICRDLGIQVWGIPELIYLITKFAPISVFPPHQNCMFSLVHFRQWWQQREQSRLMAA